MTSIRLMTVDDIDAVRALDVQAWAAYVHRTTGQRESMRTREHIQACLALNPDGCFVAEDNGLAGYIFSRCWGNLGWIGTFGVHPSQQGEGLGRQLLNAAIASLESFGCTTIGLETMPDSPYNVGFYMHYGFRPVDTMIMLGKNLTSPGTILPFTVLGASDITTSLNAIAQIGSSIPPGLDYQGDAQNALTYEWGETLLFGSPDPWAFAIVQTRPTREGPMAKSTIWIHALVIAPHARHRLGEVMQTLEAFALQRDVQHLLVWVDATDWTSSQWFLNQNFRVTRLALRLLLKGQYGTSTGIVLGRWAM